MIPDISTFRLAASLRTLLIASVVVALLALVPNSPVAEAQTPNPADEVVTVKKTKRLVDNERVRVVVLGVSEESELRIEQCSDDARLTCETLTKVFAGSDATDARIAKSVAVRRAIAGGDLDRNMVDCAARKDRCELRVQVRDAGAGQDAWTTFGEPVPLRFLKRGPKLKVKIRPKGEVTGGDVIKVRTNSKRSLILNECALDTANDVLACDRRVEVPASGRLDFVVARAVRSTSTNGAPQYYDCASETVRCGFTDLRKQNFWEFDFTPTTEPFEVENVDFGDLSALTDQVAVPVVIGGFATNYRVHQCIPEANRTRPRQPRNGCIVVGFGKQGPQRVPSEYQEETVMALARRVLWFQQTSYDCAQIAGCEFMVEGEFGNNVFRAEATFVDEGPTPIPAMKIVGDVVAGEPVALEMSNMPLPRFFVVRQCVNGSRDCVTLMSQNLSFTDFMTQVVPRTFIITSQGRTIDCTEAAARCRLQVEFNPGANRPQVDLTFG